MKRVLLASLLAMLAGVSACGMNQAVGVLPNAADRLADETRGFRGDRAPDTTDARTP